MRPPVGVSSPVATQSISSPDGSPPISTKALGIVCVCSRSRVPRPRQRITTLGAPMGGHYGPPGRASVPREARGEPPPRLHRLVDHRARGALEAAALAERHAEYAPPRVAGDHHNAPGEPGHRGAGPRRDGNLALAAALRILAVRLSGSRRLALRSRRPALRGHRLAVAAYRGSLRLTGRARGLVDLVGAVVAMAHPEPSSSYRVRPRDGLPRCPSGLLLAIPLPPRLHVLEHRVDDLAALGHAVGERL